MTFYSASLMYKCNNFPHKIILIFLSIHIEFLAGCRSIPRHRRLAAALTGQVEAFIAKYKYSDVVSIPRICELFHNEKIGLIISGGAFRITQGKFLNPIYADCLHALEEIEKIEADRELDNTVKRCNIKYARRAFWISILALFVAAASLLWQIIRARA